MKIKTFAFFAVLSFLMVNISAKPKELYKVSVQEKVKLNKYNKQLGYQLINNGDTVVFTITKDMTDELIEIGDYYLQFHIGNKEDDTDTSYFSIPEFKFTVKKKLTGKSTTNLTYIAAEDGTVMLDENGEVMLCLVEE